MIIKNMVIPNKPVSSRDNIGALCDQGMVYSLCALIFVLPVSIAMLDSFAGLAIFFYLFKKINRIAADWPLKIFPLNGLGKMQAIWHGFTPRINILNRPLQILAVAFFISAVFSQYPTLSLLAYLGKFLKCVFLYFSFIEVFRDEKRVLLFLKVFFVSAFMTILSGVFQHYTGKDFLRGHLMGTENYISTHRINSSFFSANALGTYLLPVIGLIAHLFYTAMTRKKSWILAIGLAFFLILLTACLCWTYSRSSWIGYLALLFVMVLIDRRKIFFTAALVLVFIFTFLPSLNNTRHLYLINDNSGGTVPKVASSFQCVKSIIEEGGSGRITYWKKAVSIIHSSPVWGTGLNTYTKVIKRDPNPGSWWYAHNSYLQMTAETGFLGLFCFLWVIFVLLRHSFDCCQKVNGPARMALRPDAWPLTLLQGVLSGLCGLLVQSFFDNTFYTVQLSVLIWLIFGLTVVLVQLNFDSLKE